MSSAGPAIQSKQLGVYRIVTEKYSVNNQWSKKARQGLCTLLRLTNDIYDTAGPWSFALMLVLTVWVDVFDRTVGLHLVGRVLAVIEEGLKAGRVDGVTLAWAVALRTLGLGLTTGLGYWGARLRTKMDSRFEAKMQEFVLKTKLATDLTGVSANLSTSQAAEQVSFSAFIQILRALTVSLGTALQLGYVFRLVRSTGHGPILAFVCLAHPVLEFLMQPTLWTISHIVEATDPHYLRMNSLRRLGEARYRQDILMGDVVGYVLREFRRSVELLGDTDVGQPYVQYERMGHSSHLALKIAKELPMLYYAAIAILNPGAFTLSTLATLHQSESMLSRMFVEIVFYVQHGAPRLASVQTVYDLEKSVHEMQDGDLAYSPHEQGMSFELRNVSFSYPGTTAKALNDVSLSIKPGQLVVIVGSNGSGKSTIIKLLTRLYDATCGSILVDGQDIKDYRVADLRMAMASLTQDHHLYPLSLGENIGLGNPARVGDVEMIWDAARLGGAEGVVDKMTDGLGTVLEWPRGLQWNNVGKGNQAVDPELRAAVGNMKKQVAVSGGERQRLVASRTFMRFTSGTVKLVCVDEPSSNLDPQAEWQLFDNLRRVREGKTMIFVTHRFGHLTKHADVILCMKEGDIVESGTHEELIEMGGEYCRMFDIQAKAFD
ncbi:P-loop containing nucleoside triphosphate hydrolase protein [Roridomyces roridus]|uniref:P-loop containing nucleoside triphosphate hydrolase protein n=1 Tax=Roridomyces roridus TaxID=1738132 RepID=A0AAD7G0I8_9AGAR|nr:P-loop containing nucleoside triphosphate hydrolase protein [Roridomyces roridus]